jgi:hypothetical protein
VHAAESGGECGYVGIFSGSDARAARRVRLVLFLVFGGLGVCQLTGGNVRIGQRDETYGARHDDNLLD